MPCSGERMLGPLKGDLAPGAEVPNAAGGARPLELASPVLLPLVPGAPGEAAGLRIGKEPVGVELT